MSLMPRGGAHFTPDELRDVLSHYDIGNIIQIKTLNAGNAGAPKKTILSDRGKFLLKRRPKDKSDIYHVAFSHAIQTHLEEKGFPVAGFIRTRKANNTAVHRGNNTYELFNFVAGSRYNGSNQAAHNSGRQLAVFHKHLMDFLCRFDPLRRTYHDSSSVRGYLKTISSSKAQTGSCDFEEISLRLMALYNQSSAAVNQLGFDSWPVQIVHGDWHPGNLLFAGESIVCVLDFDSAKLAPVVTDVASGLVHFSIVAGRPTPVDWPAYLDKTKFTNLLNGYRQTTELNDDMLNALPDLMIEIMIAEAVLPVAATGFFGNFSGLDFLNMIQRKCEWIDGNRNALKEAISN
jgi:Ser/Thr protein kinase RdoA (MazF antagonist)